MATAPYNHYRVKIKPSSVLYLSQKNPIHFLTHYFSNPTNVLPSTCKSRGVSSRAGFAHLHARYIFCPSSLICSNVHLFLYKHKHTLSSRLCVLSVTAGDSHYHRASKGWSQNFHQNLWL